MADKEGSPRRHNSVQCYQSTSGGFDHLRAVLWQPQVPGRLSLHRTQWQIETLTLTVLQESNRIIP